MNPTYLPDRLQIKTLTITNMRQLFYLLILPLPYAAIAADSTTLKPIVTQTIVYKTAKASEVYFVWTMENWKIPDKIFQPAGTYTLNGMVYTKMNGSKDSFDVTLKLPKGIYIDFMIWASKDVAGDSLQGWDNNWGSNYNFYIDGKNKTKTITDEKLGIAKKDKPKEKPFNILEKGWTIFTAGILIFFIALIIKFLKNKSNIWTTRNHFIAALLLATFLVMLLTRLQITDHLLHKQYLALGLGYYDLILVFFLAVVSCLLLYFSTRLKSIHYGLQLFLGLIIFLAAISSVLNVEVVRQLGKPLTYSWLYYSDFLQGNDAKNAIKAGFTPLLLRNIAFIAAGLLLAALGFSIISHLLFTKSKQTALIITIVSLFILITSCLQFNSHKFEQGKVQNPFTSIALSWLNEGKKSQLFTMKVSAETKETIEEMHTAKSNEPIPFSDSIKNVIVFVLESTPANLIQVYDSTYKVTPYLNEWKKHAVIYNNMYAHLPNTVNSIFSITSGMYPMISYKAIINEHPHIAIPTLSQLLKDKGWNTSLFYSSDLTYSNIGEYVSHHGFQTVEDFKTIRCGFDQFQSNYAQLDGLDDRCIVSRYLDWKDSMQGQKTFSMLWANQTHYPYFSHDKNKYTDNAELNPYLNALRNVDEAFNQLMQGLKKRNSLNNTLVIVVGDHGESFGTHNQYSHASKIYEENLHVPCLIINPALFNGATNNRIGGLIDIAPTVMHLLNMKAPDEWQGVSLLSTKQKSHTFFVGPFSDFLFGSRFDNWKLIFNATSNYYELYNVNKDPKELENVANKHPGIIKKEYEMLAGWVQYHNKRVHRLVENK